MSKVIGFAVIGVALMATPAQAGLWECTTKQLWEVTNEGLTPSVPPTDAEIESNAFNILEVSLVNVGNKIFYDTDTGRLRSNGLLLPQDAQYTVWDNRARLSSPPPRGV